MNILKIFSSAKAIANADIRSIRKCFEFKGQGKRISLSAEQLKLTAKSSIGIPSVAEEIQIRHLVSQIELLEKQYQYIFEDDFCMCLTLLSDYDDDGLTVSARRGQSDFTL